MSDHSLHGIIPPLLTPLDAELDLDGRSLEALIEHVIAGGVHGIFLLGSTGEGPALGEKLRKNVVQAGIQCIAGRVPVLVNISSTSYKETMQMAEFAAGSGAAYAVLSPPWYFEMNHGELLHYYLSVAENAPLPLVLYNAPKYTGTAIAPALVEELMGHPGIAAIKDSSGSMEYIRELLRVRHNKAFPILIGPEMLLGEALQLGCNGGVSGGANLYPALYVEYYRSVLARDQEAIDRTGKALLKIRQLYKVAASPMEIVIGLKYLLERRGLCSTQMAMPVYKALSREKKLLLNSLDQEISAL